MKPFLKWAGGKTQLLNEIQKKIPKKFNNYHEPFVGGGSVMLLMLKLIENKEIKMNGKMYIYDLNSTLINIYKNIQNNKDELYKIIEKYINEYNSIQTFNGNKKPKNKEDALSSKESYYYWLRNVYNKLNTNDITRSALFMIMNKLCFRGLYREGPNGFNVPFGNYKKTPTIISKDDLVILNKMFQNVEFKCCDFSEAFKKIKKDDYVYLDPPYVPENNTSFVSYNKEGFNIDKHNELFILIKNLKCKFQMSNSYTDKVIEEFKDYRIKKILCKRSINSKNPEAKTYEVIINN